MHLFGPARFCRLEFQPFRWLVVGLTLAALIGSADGAEAGKKKRKADGRVDLASELPADARTLKIGDPAPDFRLKGVDGKIHALADYQSAPVLMVVFLSNHCPYSHAAETRLLPMAREFAPKGLAVVAINPNSPDAVRLDELGYGKYNDTFEEMGLYAQEQGFPFPYLYDGDTQAVAKAYGALATPHVFLFDQERKLRYTGRVDDSRFADPATVTSPDARKAVEALLAGQPVTVTTTPVVGCATKWKSAATEVQEAEAAWKAAPVTLEKIDAAGVRALAANSSDRFRLVNVWATWCAPCVAEFPAFVDLSRRLANRDFEFISLSLDDPKFEAQAKAFLQKNHAAPSNRLKRLLTAEGRTTTNFIYSEASTDALVKALDPEWPGPLPHTVLIAPGGKIVWRHNGAVDRTELMAKVIDALGAYYTPGSKR